MRDDAVAPVIAIMLILAVIVTFYSVWNAVVIPSMKQSSEVEHLQSVESSFQHFSSDIDRAVSLKQDHLVFSEPVQLGGGDVVVDPLRSSGSLYVQNELNPVYTLKINSEDGIATATGNLTNIFYEPLNNYWQNQGYRWQYGYINVSKDQRQTPLNYYNMSAIENEFAGSGPLQAFADSFGTANYETASGTCSGINLTAVTLTASPDHHFVSSNGFGVLKMNSSIKITTYSKVSSLEIDPDQEPFGNETAKNWLNGITTACSNVHSDSSPGIYTIDNPNTTPVSVTLDTITIEVSAY